MVSSQLIQVQNNVVGDGINAVSHSIQVQSNAMGDDINTTDHINLAASFKDFLKCKGPQCLF
jgi:hypothetical protein